MRLFEIQFDPTTTPEFRRWFRDSEVVDDYGQPLRVFHGTRQEISRFEHGRSPAHPYLNCNDNGIGFFFTADPGTKSDMGHWGGAAGYAGVRQKEGETVANQGANIVPVYLKIISPYRFGYSEYVDAVKTAGNGEALREQLEALGYDGVFRLSPLNNGDVSDYIAFHPEQIKSVFNRGTWDAGSPHISEAASR